MKDHRLPLLDERTVADAIAESLARRGVTVTFGQSLPSAVQLALGDVGIRQFAYRTENAGSYMADGYARVSRKVGIVTAQNGPAATLLVPGLSEAHKASVPIIALVQDVPTSMVEKNAFQELDHMQLFASCSKWTKRLDNPARLHDLLNLAFVAASSGRGGPAVLLLPMDLQIARVPPAPQATPHNSDYPLDRPVASATAIRAAAGLLAASKRPLVVCGGGAHLSNASSEIADLQDLFGLPVATTVMGKGVVSELHPLSVGVIGYLMGARGCTTALRPFVENADVVLLVGTRTNQNGTDTWTLFGKSTKFIHVDIDPLEIGRNYESYRLNGDAKATLRCLMDHMRDIDAVRQPEERESVARQIAHAREVFLRENQQLVRSESAPIRPERLIGDLSSVLTKDSIVVGDASYASVWVATYLRASTHGARFLTPRGLAGLGWGVPMALGAKVAAPSATVHCVVGDGGFAHVWSELETAKRTGTKIIVTVLNNGVLGFQKDAEDVRHGRHTNACYFEPVNHAQIARACGCAGHEVQTPGQYLDALHAALQDDLPCVIDVITDPQAYPPLTAFAKLEQLRSERVAGRVQKPTAVDR
jgi:acetolactate synthase-1/2/3 large subunit